MTEGIRIGPTSACLLSLIAAIQPAFMTIFGKADAIKSQFTAVGIRTCKRGVHGLRCETEPVVDLLVPDN